MPIAGAIAWTAIGIAGALLPIPLAAWALFIGTGMIFYLGLGVARLTGEDLLGKTRKNNAFDRLFLLTVLMACLVYAIAIPFFLIEPTSLPLTVGILTGLMWVPLSGMIQHWVGIFHGVTRTVAIVTAWYLFPRHRFVAIPAVIVVIYLVTIYVLAGRRRESTNQRSSGSFRRTMRNQRKYAVCIRNDGYEESLELRRIYETLDDPSDEVKGFVRVIDEDEDYLYPASWFLPIQLPTEIEASIATHR